MNISVIVLTFNEETNLAACLESVSGLTREIFVVDSGSVDRTKEICASFGAKVYDHPFVFHVKQWEWALGNLPLQTDWVLALDADQRVTPELAKEIRALSEEELEGVDGMYLKRRQIFRDKWIRFGGYYPIYLLKMFRRKAVYLDPSDLVDHHFYVSGKTIQLRNDLIEANKKEDDIGFWIEKHNRYARLMAKEQIERKGDYPTLKKRVWARLPLFVRPFLYFIYRYVIRLGFLDGKQGAIFHFMQAFWFRLLVDINVDQNSGN